MNDDRFQCPQTPDLDGDCVPEKASSRRPFIGRTGGRTTNGHERSDQSVCLREGEGSVRSVRTVHLMLAGVWGNMCARVGELIEGRPPRSPRTTRLEEVLGWRGGGVLSSPLLSSTRASLFLCPHPFYTTPPSKHRPQRSMRRYCIHPISSAHLANVYGYSSGGPWQELCP